MGKSNKKIPYFKDVEDRAERHSGNRKIRHKVNDMLRHYDDGEDYDFPTNVREFSNVAEKKYEHNPTKRDSSK